MISCQLLHLTHSRIGLQARNEIRISAESIELGRGTACHIHLPDHRVAKLHATLRRTEDGTLRIHAEADALLSINDAPERTAVICPGTRISIGPYLLTVEPASADTDITLSVSIPEYLAQNPDAPKVAPMTLAALGISKRRLGFGLAASILLALLVLLMLPRMSPAFEAWQAKLPFALTGLLNPGPLSTSHGLFGMKCSACHQSAFRGVADVACTKCHEQTAMHLAQDVSHRKALTGAQCIDCHPAHQGKAETMKNISPQCVNCHKTIDTTVAEAKDFGTAHPRFHLAVPSGKNVVRVSQNEKTMPPEKSGIKFSHQVHLAKAGVSSPDGDTVMTCRDCHKLNESGIHFSPMSMANTCQQSRCHTLRFDDPVSGIIPHGSERDAMNILRNFHANRLAEAPVENFGECPPVAKAGSIVKRTLDCADNLARQYAAASLFRENGEELKCALCHEIKATGNRAVPWKVAPVVLTHDWQPKAVFVHAKHETIDCSGCHDKVNSKSSADISFPRIEKCRECHGGTGSFVSAARIMSSCDSCHRFHRVAKQTP